MEGRISCLRKKLNEIYNENNNGGKTSSERGYPEDAMEIAIDIAAWAKHEWARTLVERDDEVGAESPISTLIDLYLDARIAKTSNIMIEQIIGAIYSIVAEEPGEFGLGTLSPEIGDGVINITIGTNHQLLVNVFDDCKIVVTSREDGRELKIKFTPDGNFKIVKNENAAPRDFARIGAVFAAAICGDDMKCITENTLLFGKMFDGVYESGEFKAYAATAYESEVLLDENPDWMEEKNDG